MLPCCPRPCTGFLEIANFIWSIADEVLRDDFKRGQYPDVFLPFTVLCRLDCVLAPTKEKVLKRQEGLQPKDLQNVDGQLRRATGHSFYNTSNFDFPKLLDIPGGNVRVQAVVTAARLGGTGRVVL